MALAPDSSFYILNETNVNIGPVAVRMIDSSTTWIDVPDSGIYEMHLLAAPAYVLVNNQQLKDSTPEWLLINTYRIHGDWTTNVVVVDKSEQN